MSSLPTLYGKSNNRSAVFACTHSNAQTQKILTVMSRSCHRLVVIVCSTTGEGYPTTVMFTLDWLSDVRLVFLLNTSQNTPENSGFRRFESGVAYTTSGDES